MCQCRTPTTSTMAIKPTIMAPTMPKGARLLPSSSPTNPTSAAIINQMIRFPKVITIGVYLLRTDSHVPDFLLSQKAGHLIHVHVIMSLEGYNSKVQPCHPERSEGSRCPSRQTLRCAQSLPLSEAKA